MFMLWGITCAEVMAKAMTAQTSKPTVIDASPCADKPLTIALDYDKTFTRDVAFWTRFVGNAWEDGHKVYIVTARQHLQKIDLPVRAFPFITDIIYTAGRAKRKVCESRGIHIDIWIDDRPDRVDNDSPNLHI